MNSTLENYPVLVKEFTTVDYSIKIEKVKEFYIVSYNQERFNPTTSLTVALGLFESLAQAHMN